MKRTVEVSTPGVHLSQRDRQLLISREGTELGRVPLEDLGVLVLDTPHLTLTGSALEGIAECGAVLVACGSDHLPAGVFLPLVANSTHAERLRAQVSASVPLQKNLWARIVRAKIRTQAAALEDDGARRKLERLESGVRSGDPRNAEAQAAAVYWPALFADCDPRLVEQPFRRNRSGPPPNNLLNYGYAILRAAVARGLCAAGLHPGLGVHHHGRYDPMGLASDVMEPYRPWVDLQVRQLVRDGRMQIERTTKEVLLEILTRRADCGQGSGPVLAAIERTTSSLAQCLLDASNGKPAPDAAAGLHLPRFCEERENEGLGQEDEPCS